MYMFSRPGTFHESHLYHIRFDHPKMATLQLLHVTSKLVSFKSWGSWRVLYKCVLMHKRLGLDLLLHVFFCCGSSFHDSESKKHVNPGQSACEKDVCEPKRPGDCRGVSQLPKIGKAPAISMGSPVLRRWVEVETTGRTWGKYQEVASWLTTLEETLFEIHHWG